MSPPPENPPIGTAVTSPPRGRLPNEFTAEERATLLSVAHTAIERALAGQSISFDPPSPHLAELRGAFTTLYVGGELRGCVGYVFPVLSLYRTVAETARAAALEDARFRPISSEETARVEVSLSILSATQVIRPDEIEIGKHGLLIGQNGRRGLLLPQVAVEHGWDRVTFLEQTCQKAGLSADAWRQGATLEAFTAEVFGDRSLHA